MSWKFACRRLSVQTLQTVISVSAAGRRGVGEDARVQVQVVVGLGLLDVPGAAAGDRLELDSSSPTFGASACVEESSSFADSEARQPL